MVVGNILSVLMSWLPYTARTSLHKGGTEPSLSRLLKEPGMEKLADNPDVKPVLGAARMLSKDSDLPDDHLFTALLKTGLVDDMLFLLDTNLMRAHLVVKLGRDVCGHAKIVHGGLISSICDETYGALVYCMKQAEILGPEPAVTANLNINYRKPMPTGSCIICTAQLTKKDGRKLFLSSTVASLDGSSTFADSTSLFVNMRVPPPAAADDDERGTDSDFAPRAGVNPIGSIDVGPVDVHQWHRSPRYSALCADIGL